MKKLSILALSMVFALSAVAGVSAAGSGSMGENAKGTTIKSQLKTQKQDKTQIKLETKIKKMDKKQIHKTTDVAVVTE